MKIDLTPVARATGNAIAASAAPVLRQVENASRLKILETVFAVRAAPSTSRGLT